MVDLIRGTLDAQFGAALRMFEDCVERCHGSNWQAIVGKFPFWHVAYHTLFYVDLYLSRSEQDFRPQPFHRDGCQFFGKEPWPPHRPIVADQPYDKPTILGYLKTCRAKVAATMAQETEHTLAGPSGFKWLPFSRCSVHIYNIRHAQHHGGQLSALLIQRQGEGCAWVGAKPCAASGATG